MTTTTYHTGIDRYGVDTQHGSTYRWYGTAMFTLEGHKKALELLNTFTTPTDFEPGKLPIALTEQLVAWQPTFGEITDTAVREALYFELEKRHAATVTS